jgi:ankyrin repeat protein
VESERVRFNPEISAAIRARNLRALQTLLEAEPEQVGAFTPFAGGTWLHYAAREGDIEAVQHLLSLGIDVNTGDARDGRSALCDACWGGHANVVQLLLNAGAVIDTSDSERNPLFSAIVGRSIASARMLLECGVDTAVEYSGSSMKPMDAIAFAFERGELEIADLIARWDAANDDEAQRRLERARQVAEWNNSPERDR